jgi:hypothetical protein
MQAHAALGVVPLSLPSFTPESVLFLPPNSAAVQALGVGCSPLCSLLPRTSWAAPFPSRRYPPLGITLEAREVVQTS